MSQFGTHEQKVKNESRDRLQRAKNKHMEKKHKIIVIGHSHARGYAAEIKLNLDEGFEVQGFVNPGRGENTITTSAKIDIQHLSKEDVAVVWGGSKEADKNETKKGINCIQRFVKTNNHTNFILMDVPNRYDLEQISCVNK
jgi:predicted phosphodiesterase